MTSQAKMQKLYDALKTISFMDSPEYMQKNSLRVYGLTYEEALEVAYENAITEAKEAIYGMRLPKSAPTEGSK